MEFLDEKERYENGGLLRDLDISAVVLALQRVVQDEPEPETPAVSPSEAA